MTRSRDGMFRIAVVLALLIVDSSAVLAECRAEVEAAFQKLQVRGRAYRRVTTMASTVHVADPRGIRIIRETAEFIPPDRKRRILEYVGNQPPTEMMRVGERTWMRQYQAWFEGYGWVDQDTFSSGVGATKTLFECIGIVAFEGKTYAGYRTSDDDDPRREMVVVAEGMIGQEEDLAKLRQQLDAVADDLSGWGHGVAGISDCRGREPAETKRAMTGSSSSFSGRIGACRTGLVFTLTTSYLLAQRRRHSALQRSGSDSAGC
jgi:hypothetical protein